MTEFCRGYQDGYRQAFCENGRCEPTRPPRCPYPPYGEADSYKAGFRAGLQDGLSER